MLKNIPTLLLLCLFALVAAGCASNEAPTAGRIISLNDEERKLVGSWGFETAGVYLNFGQYYPDRRRVVHTRRNGNTRRTRDQWSLNHGIVSYGKGASYRIKFLSSDTVLLSATGPVPIGFDTIKMRRYSTSPDTDPIAGMEWIRSVRNNRPISDEAQAFMDEISSRPAPVQHHHQSQKCHRCSGSGSIGTGNSYTNCPECNGSGRR